MDNSPPSPSYLRTLGPGIIYAAAAVGISHLVQSTRAGADFGFTLTGVLLLICLVKYPSLRFGAEYAAATGTSLIDSYYRQGRWVVYLVAAVTFVSMFFITASLSLVTAGLFKALVGVHWPDIPVAGAFILAGGVSLIFGHYRLLERTSMVLVPLFTLAIFVAVGIVALKIPWEAASFLMPPVNTFTLVSIVALAGFMPTPVDGSILQSLWTCAKSITEQQRFTRAGILLDFNIGYVLSTVLAFGFMLLGAGVLHGSGVELSGNAGLFAAQILSLFTDAIGDWSFYLVGLCAFTVILSTLLTILDGYPRIMATVINRLYLRQEDDRLMTINLNIMVILNGSGALVVLLFLMKTFQSFIDLTAALVFLTGPLFAILNHRAVFGPEMPAQQRPGELLRWWSLSGIVVMIGAAVSYALIKS